MEEAETGPLDGVAGSTPPSPGFDGFYRAQYPLVVRLAYASTGRMDLAEELAQEAFLAAYRRWPQVGGYEDPAGWVRRVVMNRAVSAWRRRVTEAAALTRVRPRVDAAAVMPDGDDAMWAAVRRLPRRQAQVMLLIAVEDRSVADIAALLDITENSVRTHLRRAREALAGQGPSTMEDRP